MLVNWSPGPWTHSHLGWIPYLLVDCRPMCTQWQTAVSCESSSGGGDLPDAVHSWSSSTCQLQLHCIPSESSPGPLSLELEISIHCCKPEVEMTKSGQLRLVACKISHVALQVSGQHLCEARTWYTRAVNSDMEWMVLSMSLSWAVYPLTNCFISHPKGPPLCLWSA